MSSKTNQKKTLTGVMRERLQMFESRFELGERQETIVAELQAEGYATTLASFRNLLSKARAWREQKRMALPAQPAPSSIAPLAKQPGIQQSGAIRNPGNFDKGELF